MKTLTKFIHYVMIYWLLFVTVAWIAFFTRGSVPDTLVQYGLGGGAVELVAAAFIEITKKIVEKKYGLAKEEAEDDDGIRIYDLADDPSCDKQPCDAGDETAVG